MKSLFLNQYSDRKSTISPKSSERMIKENPWKWIALYSDSEEEAISYASALIHEDVSFLVDDVDCDGSHLAKICGLFRSQPFLLTSKYLKKVFSPKGRVKKVDLLLFILNNNLRDYDNNTLPAVESLQANGTFDKISKKSQLKIIHNCLEYLDTQWLFWLVKNSIITPEMHESFKVTSFHDLNTATLKHLSAAKDVGLEFSINNPLHSYFTTFNDLSAIPSRDISWELCDKPCLLNLDYPLPPEKISSSWFYNVLFLKPEEFHHEINRVGVFRMDQGYIEEFFSHFLLSLSFYKDTNDSIFLTNLHYIIREYSLFDQFDVLLHINSSDSSKRQNTLLNYIFKNCEFGCLWMNAINTSTLLRLTPLLCTKKSFKNHNLIAALSCRADKRSTLLHKLIAESFAKDKVQGISPGDNTLFDVATFYPENEPNMDNYKKLFLKCLVSTSKNFILTLNNHDFIEISEICKHIKFDFTQLLLNRELTAKAKSNIMKVMT
jgi:hypothetical protein